MREPLARITTGEPDAPIANARVSADALALTSDVNVSYSFGSCDFFRK